MRSGWSPASSLWKLQILFEMWAAGLRALARGARRSGSVHAEQLQQLRWLNIHEYQVQQAPPCSRACFACLPKLLPANTIRTFELEGICLCSCFGLCRSQLYVTRFPLWHM